ncbi:polysaccharide deacetylase family protein [Postechiella marina]|uniref:Polysaccharide deacetylase family protein n=1 Tax=Postechiella marina TaxID=943941 RepID=A0ABP8C768_9FLAO
MTLIPIKTPRFVKRMFPNYVWDIATTHKVIYLTFDDGPTPEITNWTLNLLKQYQAKATFFCIGNNIEKHPEIFQDILKDGHAIGNHTQNHVKGWKTNTDLYINETTQTQSIINAEIAKANDYKRTKSYLFRPPFGKIKNKQGKALIALGYKIIMWDILAFDWKDTSPETCYKNAISKTSQGSIVVFHDSVKAAKNMQYALPRVLEHFSKKGYSFKALN